jgi:hypothetical protein
MTMSNRQWNAMLTRNSEAKPRTKRARAEIAHSTSLWNEQFNEFARAERMQDEMNADISREMGSYYGSNEDL